MSAATDLIAAFGGVILDVPNPDEAKAAYTRLLGADEAAPQLQLGLPDWASAPGLVFAARNLDETSRLLSRRGLRLTAAGKYAVGAADGVTYAFLAAAAVPPGNGDIQEIDHIVLTSPNRDRIIATLSGRLGFDLRLDRLQQWGVHQLFFRCPGLMVEVVLRDGDPAEDDALWGIAWRTANIDATHARLSASGVSCSEIRAGAKPGTRVATVKDPALGVPTIVIEQKEPR